MADELRMALETLLRTAHGEDDVDVLRDGARVFSEALTELEVTRHDGASLQSRLGATRDEAESLAQRRHGLRRRDGP